MKSSTVSVFDMPSDAIDLLFDWREADLEEDDPHPQPEKSRSIRGW